MFPDEYQYQLDQMGVAFAACASCGGGCTPDVCVYACENGPGPATGQLACRYTVRWTTRFFAEPVITGQKQFTVSLPLENLYLGKTYGGR